jgi:hypothetical protein
MGLDMYAFTRPDALPAFVDFAQLPTDIELHYWRKHPNLHGWMERLYREMGDTDLDFNCVNLALFAEDIDRLEEDVRAGVLPLTSGFFFGESDGTEIDDDLAFITKAREALSAGAAVYYTSWW